MLQQSQTVLEFRTDGRELLEITRPVSEWVGHCGYDSGEVTLLIRHTSAALIIQENADPDVQPDLMAASSSRWFPDERFAVFATTPRARTTCLRM